MTIANTKMETQFWLQSVVKLRNWIFSRFMLKPKRVKFVWAWYMIRHLSSTRLFDSIASWVYQFNLVKQTAITNLHLLSSLYTEQYTLLMVRVNMISLHGFIPLIIPT